MSYTDNLTGSGLFLYKEWRPFITQLIAVYTAATVVGLVGNIVVAALICTLRRLQNVTNMYIFYRSLADIVFQSVGPMWVALMVQRNFSLSYFSCFPTTLLIHVGIVTSSMFFVLFVIDFCFTSCSRHHTLDYRWEVHKIAAIVTWAAGVLVVVPACSGSWLIAEDSWTNFSVVPYFSGSNIAISFIYIYISAIVPVIVLWIFVTLTFPSQSIDTKEKTKALVRTSEDSEEINEEEEDLVEDIVCKSQDSGEIKETEGVAKAVERISEEFREIKEEERSSVKTIDGQFKDSKEIKEEGKGVARKTVTSEEGNEPQPRSLLLSLPLTITVCQGPYWVLKVVMCVVPMYSSLSTYIRFWILCLFGASFVIHPILYLWHIKDLWHNFRSCDPYCPAPLNPPEVA